MHRDHWLSSTWGREGTKHGKVKIWNVCAKVNMLPYPQSWGQTQDILTKIIFVCHAGALLTVCVGCFSFDSVIRLCMLLSLSQHLLLYFATWYVVLSASGFYKIQKITVRKLNVMSAHYWRDKYVKMSSCRWNCTFWLWIDTSLIPLYLSLITLKIAKFNKTTSNKQKIFWPRNLCLSELTVSVCGDGCQDSHWLVHYLTFTTGITLFKYIM